MTMDGFVNISNNKAIKYATVYLEDSEANINGNIVFSNNSGSFVTVASNTNVSFTGNGKFLGNKVNPQADGFQEGGAITLSLSNITVVGSCTLSHNHAENGGAIHSTESKFNFNHCPQLG